ncbi:hypothetical protein AB0H28_12540 [Micromonospora sp. NPDC050980]
MTLSVVAVLAAPQRLEVVTLQVVADSRRVLGVLWRSRGGRRW